MKDTTRQLLRVARRVRSIVHRHHPCRKYMAESTRAARREFGRKATVQYALTVLVLDPVLKERRDND